MKPTAQPIAHICTKIRIEDEHTKTGEENVDHDYVAPCKCEVPFRLQICFFRLRSKMGLLS